MSPAPQRQEVTCMKRIHTALLAMLLGSALLAGCERPSMESSQIGNRGLAMGQGFSLSIEGEQGHGRIDTRIQIVRRNLQSRLVITVK